MVERTSSIARIGRTRVAARSLASRQVISDDSYGVFFPQFIGPHSIIAKFRLQTRLVIVCASNQQHQRKCRITLRSVCDTFGISIMLEIDAGVECDCVLEIDNDDALDPNQGRKRFRDVSTEGPLSLHGIIGERGAWGSRFFLSP